MALHPKEDDKVTARVIFAGVMFGCINTDEDNYKRYEIGMIKCPEHPTEIKIKKNNEPEELFDWPEGHDLIFEVANPQEKGIRMYPTNAADDVAEANFNLVVDLEGPDFHPGGITVDTAQFDGRRIGVTAGLLYTHELTTHLNLVTWTPADPRAQFVKELDKIAKEIGLNIVCHEGQENGIAIVDAVTGERLRWMPAVSGDRYRIEVNNDCNRHLSARLRPPLVTPEENADAASPAAPSSGASDFRFQYQVITPIERPDRRFDFVVRLIRGMRPDPSPDVCIQTGGGRTPSIGLDWSAVSNRRGPR